MSVASVTRARALVWPSGQGEGGVFWGSCVEGRGHGVVVGRLTAQATNTTPYVGPTYQFSVKTTFKQE